MKELDAAIQESRPKREGTLQGCEAHYKGILVEECVCGERGIELPSAEESFYPLERESLNEHLEDSRERKLSADAGPVRLPEEDVSRLES